MDNNMTTAAAYMSGRSSSASSTGTGSSAGGGAGNGSGGDGRMAVIGVTRNVRLRRGYPGFGFSLRGGLEYGAGFYVSDVEPGGEAHKMGLRVGDQILRMNGHPVEDAVHREIALLAKHRQDLVLKIRSVGMIPVKDNPNDPVTWHMVQQQHHQQQLQQQQQQQQQQLQPQQQQQQQHALYKGAVASYNQVRLRIHVGEKGRLGCGVCRGIVPGLTVQGTREGGPARAAGLKAGDVIIWCNGQRLTNIPFERAIEVMRGADILEVVVNRPVITHPPPYDYPAIRASPGYDMTRSFGPYNNPPAGIINLKGGWPMSMSTSSCSSSDWSSSTDQASEWSRKPNNTTVIRINQNMKPAGGYPCHPAYRQNQNTAGCKFDNEEPLYDPVAPRDYESHDFDANPRDDRNSRTCYVRDNASATIYDCPPIDERNAYNLPNKDNARQDNRLGDCQSNDRKTVTTVEVHQSGCPPAPPCMPPPMPHKWQPETKPMIAMGVQMGSTLSMGSTGSTETESSLESSCGGGGGGGCKDSASTSSSVSTSSCEPASTVSFASTIPGSTGCAIKPSEAPRPARPCSTMANSPSPSTDLGTAITQELQRRAQQRLLNAAKTDTAKEISSSEPKKTQNPEALRAQENKVTHDKLMEEFKRAHRRMFNGNLQRIQPTDQQEEKDQENKRVTNGTSGGPPPPPLPAPVESPTAKSPAAEDAVEMQSIESFKLKESPSPSTIPPKPPSTYFSVSNSGANSPTLSNGGSPSRHSLSPAKNLLQSNGLPNQSVNDNNNNNNNNLARITTPDQQKPSPPIGKVAPVVPMSTFGPGKIAVRIGAYEGETKQPSRLDFLPPAQTPPRAPELPAAKIIPEQVVDGPVVSRLQNELAATLQRSNLRKKTEVENNAGIKQIAECPAVPIRHSSTELENGAAGVSLLQSNVEKLAAALSNRVTIKVSPENGSR